MAMNRKIREAIINAIREEKAVTVDEVVEIVKTYEEMPEVKTWLSSTIKKWQEDFCPQSKMIMVCAISLRQKRQLVKGCM